MGNHYGDGTAYRGVESAPSSVQTLTEIDLLKKEVELLRADPAMHYCHRFSILLECLMLSQDLIRYWREAGELLDEYNEAQHQWREMAGEPYVSGFGKD